MRERNATAAYRTNRGRASEAPAARPQHPAPPVAATRASVVGACILVTTRPRARFGRCTMRPAPLRCRLAVLWRPEAMGMNRRALGWVALALFSAGLVSADPPGGT